MTPDASSAGDIVMAVHDANVKLTPAVIAPFVMAIGVPDAGSQRTARAWQVAEQLRGVGLAGLRARPIASSPAR